MSTFSFGKISPSTPNVKLSGQVLEATVIVKDLVYFDSVAGNWKKSILDALVSKIPIGIVENLGAGDIVLSGQLTVTGLTSGKIYYWDEATGLITTTGKFRIGFAISNTVLIVDIDSEAPLTGIGKGEYSASGSASDSVAIDKLLFSSSNISQITSSLSKLRSSGGSYNSSTFGYMSEGGFSGTNISDIEKIKFSDDSHSIVSTTFASGSTNQVSFEDANTAGFSANGSLNSFTPLSRTDKVLYSNDSFSSVGAWSAFDSNTQSGFNSISNGYYSGGSNGPGGPPAISTIGRFQFSNNSAFDGVSSLNTARGGVGGFESSLDGYSIGGGVTSTVEKLLFSTNSNSVVVTKLFEASISATQGFNSALAGYSAGGAVSSVSISSIFKLTFSGDLFSTEISMLSNITSAGAGFENPN